MANWTEDLPTEKGWYWVWQPEDQWPCCGVVRSVSVWPNYSTKELEATVPGMEYADPLSEDTWARSQWQGPVDAPPPPQ